MTLGTLASPGAPEAGLGTRDGACAVKEEALEGSDEVRYAADCASSEAGETMPSG